MQAGCAIQGSRDGAQHGENASGNARDPTRVRQLLDTLCDQGFLVTRLRPPLTGSPAEHVVTVLRSSDGMNSAASELAALLAELRDWEALAPAEAVRRWPRLAESARRVNDVEPAFQVELGFLIRTVHAIGTAAARRGAGGEVGNGSAVPTCHRGATVSGADQWRSAFEEEYGVDREVPVLDLIQRGLPEPTHGAAPNPTRDRILLRLAGVALRDRSAVVELDSPLVAELERTRGQGGHPPASADLYCAVAAESAAALDAGRFLLVGRRWRLGGASGPLVRSVRSSAWAGAAH